MAVTEHASSLASLAQRQVDRVVSPSTRREAWDGALDFASRRPALFVCLPSRCFRLSSVWVILAPGAVCPSPSLSWLTAIPKKALITLLTTLCLPPTLLFATFVVSCLLFALGAAVLFTLFWTGVALLLLVPSLFIAAGCTIFLWSWALGSFVAARWLAQSMGYDFGWGSDAANPASGQKSAIQSVDQDRVLSLNGRKSGQDEFDYKQDSGSETHGAEMRL